MGTIFLVTRLSAYLYSDRPESVGHWNPTSSNTRALESKKMVFYMSKVAYFKQMQFLWPNIFFFLTKAMPRLIFKTIVWSLIYSSIQAFLTYIQNIWSHDACTHIHNIHYAYSDIQFLVQSLTHYFLSTEGCI